MNWFLVKTSRIEAWKLSHWFSHGFRVTKQRKQERERERLVPENRERSFGGNASDERERERERERRLAVTAKSYFVRDRVVCGKMIYSEGILVKLSRYIKGKKGKNNLDHFSIYACHPCVGAMLIFSVSFQFYQMSPKGHVLVHLLRI